MHKLSTIALTVQWFALTVQWFALTVQWFALTVQNVNFKKWLAVLWAVGSWRGVNFRN